MKEFPDGFTHTFLYRVAATGVKCVYPDYLDAPLSDVVEHCLNKLKTSRSKSRCLKNLILNENGELEVIEYTVR